VCAAFGRRRLQIIRAASGILRNSSMSAQLPDSVPMNTIAARANGSLAFYNRLAYECWRFQFAQKEVAKVAQTAIEYPLDFQQSESGRKWSVRRGGRCGWWFPAAAPARSAPLRSGGGRCRCRLCRGYRLRRGRHVIGIIEAHPGHAPCDPSLALRHRRVKAFDAAAVASVYFHADRIARVVPLSPGRRCGEDYSCRKNQPNQSAHDVPPEPACFIEHVWQR